MLTPLLDIAVNRQGCLGRREFIANLAGSAAAGALTLGWRDMLVARAAELRKKGKSIILLWMDGGPSQFDTFNPKVGSPNQGPARAISTNVAGVEFADFWPQTAMMMDNLAVVRSMRTPEA